MNRKSIQILNISSQVVKYGAANFLIIILLLNDSKWNSGLISAVEHNTVKNERTLELVQILIRHGARNPDKTYPTDPYNNESYWPGGWHQLTPLGIEQEYNVGRYLRNRYKNFISEEYIPKEIHVLSSDVDRTIQSANALLAGFYPPNESIEKSKIDKIKWKPVPIHTIPNEYDNIIRQEAPCPRYKQISDEFKATSTLLQQFRDENKELFEYFSLHTGFNITSPSDFSKFYDTLVIENYLNYTLPEWAKPVVNTGNSTFLGNFYFQMLTYTPEMKLLRTGPLLAKLKQNFQARIAGESPKKMHIFSGHDHTITTVMDSLGVFNKFRPPFASVLIFELHKLKEDNIYQVQIHYRNDTNSESYLITLPSCGSLEYCEYDQFWEILQKYIPDDWQNRCQLKYEEMYMGYGGWLVLLALLVVLTIFTGCLFSRSFCKFCDLHSCGYNTL